MIDRQQMQLPFGKTQLRVEPELKLFRCWLGDERSFIIAAPTKSEAIADLEQRLHPEIVIRCEEVPR